jgi:hypothetical protein
MARTNNDARKTFEDLPDPDANDMEILTPYNAAPG